MKIRNFTVEGKYLTLVAHLDFETHTKPVYDLFLRDEQKLVNLPEAEMAEMLEEIREEAYNLHHDYDIRQMRGRFDEDWREDNGVRLCDVAEE